MFASLLLLGVFVKVFVGRIPKEHHPKNMITDSWVYYQLQNKTIEELAADIMQADSYIATVNTFNPLLLNYFTDEWAKQNIFYMKHDVLTMMGDDAHMVDKLSWGGPGEAISDAHYILI